MYQDVHFIHKGQDVVLYPYVTFIQPERIYLADCIVISEYAYLQGGLGCFVGSFVHIANHASIAGGGVAILEDFAGLAAGVRLITGSENVDIDNLTGPTIPSHLRSPSRSYVHIEKHAIIFTNSVIHPGVTIGEGAVVGSCSLVTEDIEPWTVNIGIPARPIRTRSQGRIKELGEQAYLYKNVVPHKFQDFTARNHPLLSG